MALARLSLRHRLRELQELGVAGSAFRIGWELKRRSGFFELTDRPPVHDAQTRRAIAAAPDAWRSRAIFATPELVRDRIAPQLGAAQREELTELARQASGGRILSYSHDLRSYGDPIEWHRDPVTGSLVDPTLHWARALSSAAGDVKDRWEVGRFPHAYAMVRAATFTPELAPELGRCLQRQIDHFIAQNPFARGVHWASGQEIAFRLFAWTFALQALLLDTADEDFLVRLASHVHDAGVHIERHVDYARHATYNNHLLSEAVGLLLVACLLAGAPVAARFEKLGRELLEEGIGRQFYEDGGYIQQAHNYHRVALQDLLWAVAIVRAEGKTVPDAWRDAGRRSLDFLVAQQAPDGSLPNYGNNDGALVSPLSTCRYADFRPVLQAVSVSLCGRRLYPEGPWDEEATWFNGALPAAAPVVRAPRSQSFPASGHHVLRGRDAGTFAVFRCGTLIDRFTQIDMLNLDVFWRGHNVIVDAGSYRYNGAPEWHGHFLGTASHNTLTIDDENQMLHVRQFKTLYPAEARLLSFQDNGDHALCAGEHLGYGRLAGNPVHRRSVLFVADDLWVVVDTVLGTGQHTVRLQWLLSPLPIVAPGVIETPAGPFAVAVFDEAGGSLELDVQRGGESPPRGWLSRHYAHKQPAPSVVVRRAVTLPATFLSVLGAAPVRATKDERGWSVGCATATAHFALAHGLIRMHQQPNANGSPS